MDKKEIINQYMEKLSISYKEAEELYLSDYEGIETLEQAELTKKAKQNIKTYIATEKNKQKRKRERKVDEEKLTILQKINTVVNGVIIKELQIDFNYNDTDFSLKLIRHNKKDEK